MTAPVYRYNIHAHFDGHAPDSDPNSGINVGVFQHAYEACNELLRIADVWEQHGGTINGAGFILYVTAQDGQQITYRTWQV